jgi:hypothetical protein
MPATELTTARGRHVTEDVTAQARTFSVIEPSP